MLKTVLMPVLLDKSRRMNLQKGKFCTLEIHSYLPDSSTRPGMPSPFPNTYNLLRSAHAPNPASNLASSPPVHLIAAENPNLGIAYESLAYNTSFSMLSNIVSKLIVSYFLSLLWFILSELLLIWLSVYSFLLICEYRSRSDWLWFKLGDSLFWCWFSC